MSFRPTIRTTIGGLLEKQYDFSGIYVIASYPSLGCLYVGISNNIYQRFCQHIESNEPLADYIKHYFLCSYSWRVDLFEINDREEQRKIEKKLVQYFRPVFNSQHLGE